VRELLGHMHVDCLGDCLNNTPFPLPDSRSEVGWEQRSVHALSGYRFVLAFENSDAPHYVTEKLFHAFYAGAVPVVCLETWRSGKCT
jgi:Glycosyltransferase family 10 (fucosyltransferase) C-term